MTTILKDTRKQNRMTQNDLATVIGYSLAQIKRLEKTGNPPAPAQAKLLKIYTCYRNLTTNSGKWRTAYDMQLFARKVVSILEKD